VIDVVPVTDEGNDEPLDPAEPLAHREHVRESLTRMLAQRGGR
jgi:hypothetical protein